MTYSKPKAIHNKLEFTRQYCRKLGLTGVRINQPMTTAQLTIHGNIICYSIYNHSESEIAAMIDEFKMKWKGI